ncbi:protein phosphatase 1 regulatory subunit 27-like [Xyrauchen texanus]|uniref:protein phosphatase 1 regulatory subunit 27-like n=1 Tax=Xyrauchen texanus TaxID=154827 RepID=UPI00224267A4|nr:protein phosphatase 1 regulatory subunit 27-like [Xyrauchen texanus]
MCEVMSTPCTAFLYQSSGPLACSRPSVKTVRNVHFPNDIVFQDYVRQGELERIGCFLTTRRVSLETIYHSEVTLPYASFSSKPADLDEFCIFRYLLSLGADTEAENDCGERPADLIEPDCKELLEIF